MERISPLAKIISDSRMRAGLTGNFQPEKSVAVVCSSAKVRPLQFVREKESQWREASRQKDGWEVLRW
jgi:hypothetical protein